MASPINRELLSCLKMARRVIVTSQRTIMNSAERVLAGAATKEVEIGMEEMMKRIREMDAKILAEIDRCIERAEEGRS